MAIQLTITLTDREVESLQKIISGHKSFETKECTLEDAIHECIRTAFFDESETSAQQEGM
jgi:hypothetical protein